MMIKGIDCAQPLNKAKAIALAGLGQRFIARYLVPAQYAWKRLTRAEAEAISLAGLQLMSVFEADAGRPLGGTAAGKPDGKLALAEAKAIGQPLGTAIYFAVDIDTKAKDYDVIERYLKAASIEITGYQLGVYGECEIIEEMAKRIPGIKCWQTYAWSGGKKSAKAHIYQYKNGETLAGHPVDLNESYGNEGWWSTKPPVVIPEPVKEKFPDVPANHWARTAILQAAESGIMSGYADGTFKPEQSVTRAELAAAFARMKGAK